MAERQIKAHERCLLLVHLRSKSVISPELLASVRWTDMSNKYQMGNRCVRSKDIQKGHFDVEPM